MTTQLKIASAQLNPCVGDINGNYEKAVIAFEQAREAGADLLVLPELFIIGYPPEDLVLKNAAVEDCRAAVEKLAAATQGEPDILIGLPWRDGAKLYNAVALLSGGEIEALRFKNRLPNYGVFDEARVFDAGPLPDIITYKGVKLGVPVCEDIWHKGVARHLADQGAELLIVPNGSPWRRTARKERFGAVHERLENAGLPMVYVNQIGGQDELVFDGASFCVDADGNIGQQLSNFTEDFDVSTWTKVDGKWRCEGRVEGLSEDLEADWQAMCLGLGDYVNKNGFKQVVLGLSGGIDSAMAAAIAVDALGPDRVWCVMMPSRYTSGGSLDDAKDCAERLGCRYDIIPIKPGFDALLEMTDPFFKDLPPSTAEENIQSRLRAVTLMALSNKFGPMLITTGNKSEMAVGYATLYGDMCGGYNPLKDVYKTEVFALAKWRNENNPRGLRGPDNPIPAAIITKPPSAELRDDQKDEDSLPPYEVLDDILYGLIEREEGVENIIARGHKPEIVRRIQNLLYIAEYKRRQAPPGVKIGPRNFGRDRRYPITNRYRDHVPDKD